MIRISYTTLFKLTPIYFYRATLR